LGIVADVQLRLWLPFVDDIGRFVRP